eukprot:scaffold15394_cov111-Isochrysis_galbana.AAC.13
MTTACAWAGVRRSAGQPAGASSTVARCFTASRWPACLQVWDDHHRFFACSLSKLPAAGTAVETSRPNECGLALPHFSRACHNPELPRTPQRGGGFHRNAPVEPMSPRARAALGASCVDYFQRAWPKDTVWCKMLTPLSRRRCTYLTVNGAPCNTSAEQVGCPATARPAKRL